MTLSISTPASERWCWRSRHGPPSDAPNPRSTEVTMPKSEFNDQLAAHGGQVTVSGVVDPDTTARATNSGADVDVRWVIAQGELVAHGHVHADGKTFSQKDQHGRKRLKVGPGKVS